MQYKGQEIPEEQEVSLQEETQSPLRTSNNKSFQAFLSPSKSNARQFGFGKIRGKSLKEIRQSFEPQKVQVNEMISEINTDINEMFYAVDKYSSQLQNSPFTKIGHILKQQYTLFEKAKDPEKTVSGKTSHSTAYLHGSVLYRQGVKSHLRTDTKFQLITKALSDGKSEERLKSLVILVRHQDLNKKRQVIKKIQERIDLDEKIRKEEEEARIQKELAKAQEENHIGQLTLDMIANLRQKYFTELTAKNQEEKFKKIQEIKDVYIPEQIQNAKQQYSINQKQQLKNEMLSKRSQFNSYYGLLALESSVKRLVKMKLKGELSSYSRFKNFKSLDNHALVKSPVQRYIRQGQGTEQFTSTFKSA